MGKGRKQQQLRKRSSRLELDADDVLPSSAYDTPPQEHPQDNEYDDEHPENNQHDYLQQEDQQRPSKFSLYQRSVQSPKGDISYMQKFFLTYIGGRQPLHLREDFCGTALISAEWLRSDPRRTALGVDLDIEALTWGLDNNISKLGFDAYSRIRLFHGNVLNSLELAKVITSSSLDFDKCQISGLTNDGEDGAINQAEVNYVSFAQKEEISEPGYYLMGKGIQWRAADVVCAFNYSCCCLQKRSELVLYFKQAFDAISIKGGIFVMDIYGGLSSECALKLRRKFDDFSYMWEQEDFDIITRTTNISLHYIFKNNQQSLRHAFRYHWRVWTLPEIRDCLEEAGFGSVHFWVRDMPNLQEKEELNNNTMYVEASSFKQEDAWNAYIVGVKQPPKKIRLHISIREIKQHHLDVEERSEVFESPEISSTEEKAGKVPSIRRRIEYRSIIQGKVTAIISRKHSSSSYSSSSSLESVRVYYPSNIFGS